jgi:5-methyltetrahydrofolate--homocysteine methyltransferase
VNTSALFQGQWGLKKGRLSDEQFEKSITETARARRSRRSSARVEGFIEPKVTYGYFPAQADGDDLIVYHPEAFIDPRHLEAKPVVGCGCGNHGVSMEQHGMPGLPPNVTSGDAHVVHGKLAPHAAPQEWMRFKFPRQEGRRRLCISDFYRTRESGEYDISPCNSSPSATARPSSPRRCARRTRTRTTSTCTASASSVPSAGGVLAQAHPHELGFSSEDDPNVRKLFQQQYRGSRYSFGYPACPNLEDRAMVALLCPSRSASR